MRPELMPVNDKIQKMKQAGQAIEPGHAQGVNKDLANLVNPINEKIKAINENLKIMNLKLLDLVIDDDLTGGNLKEIASQIAAKQKEAAAKASDFTNKNVNLKKKELLNTLITLVEDAQTKSNFTNLMKDMQTEITNSGLNPSNQSLAYFLNNEFNGLKIEQSGIIFKSTDWEKFKSIAGISLKKLDEDISQDKDMPKIANANNLIANDAKDLGELFNEISSMLSNRDQADKSKLDPKIEQKIYRAYQFISHIYDNIEEKFKENDKIDDTSIAELDEIVAKLDKALDSKPIDEKELDAIIIAARKLYINKQIRYLEGLTFDLLENDSDDSNSAILKYIKNEMNLMQGTDTAELIFDANEIDQKVKEIKSLHDSYIIEYKTLKSLITTLDEKQQQEILEIYKKMPVQQRAKVITGPLTKIHDLLAKNNINIDQRNKNDAEVKELIGLIKSTLTEYFPALHTSEEDLEMKEFIKSNMDRLGRFTAGDKVNVADLIRFNEILTDLYYGVQRAMTVIINATTPKDKSPVDNLKQVMLDAAVRSIPVRERATMLTSNRNAVHNALAKASIFIEETNRNIDIEVQLLFKNIKKTIGAIKENSFGVEANAMEDYVQALTEHVESFEARTTVNLVELINLDDEYTRKLGGQKVMGAFLADKPQMSALEQEVEKVNYYIDKIKNTSPNKYVKNNDVKMSEFIQEQIKALTEASGDVGKIRELSESLKTISEGLEKEVNAVLDAANELRGRTFSRKVDTKLEKIMTAIQGMEIVDRAKVLSSGRRNEVTDALQTKRYAFFGKDLPLDKEGAYKKNQSTKSYQSAMEKAGLLPDKEEKKSKFGKGGK